MEASEVIGEVQRYWEAVYANRPVNLPAFERLVRAHIPRGVPDDGGRYMTTPYKTSRTP